MTKTANPETHDLPPLIRQLADAIGEDAAVQLFQRFKGRHLTIPFKIPPGNVIAETIGDDKAALLCKHFRGENLMFPNGAYLLRRRRDEQIRAEWQKGGVTQGELATRYQLTERRINAIINTNKAKP